MLRARCYSELRRLPTFEERFDYLAIPGRVGEPTFGDRWVNQRFYTSLEWRRARDAVIVRDAGCDLGIPGMQVTRGLIVHHMEPMTVDDILAGEQWILDPEFLVVTSLRTHNAIHFGDASLLQGPYIERSAGDTRLW